MISVIVHIIKSYPSILLSPLQQSGSFAKNVYKTFFNTLLSKNFCW